MADRIAIGDLMSCCVKTLWEHIAETPVGKDGDTLQCRFCDEWMRLDSEGSWRWNPRTKDVFG